MGSNGVLLYCVTNSNIGNLLSMPSLDRKNKLYKIEYNDISGVVSNVSLDEYGEENINEHSEDAVWLTRKAEDFMGVLVELCRASVIIPMKFLTIFKSEERVLGVLRENYDDFILKLNRLKGFEEWSIKIYCDCKYYKSNCMGGAITEFEKEIEGKPKGVSFMLRKKFNSELDEKVQDRIMNTANVLINEIKSLCADSKLSRLLGRELTGRNEGMLINCTLLLDMKGICEVLKLVEKMKAEYEKQGFIIDFTGPWPPYSFCS